MGRQEGTKRRVGNGIGIKFFVRMYDFVKMNPNTMYTYNALKQNM